MTYGVISDQSTPSETRSPLIRCPSRVSHPLTLTGCSKPCLQAQALLAAAADEKARRQRQAEEEGESSGAAASEERAAVRVDCRLRVTHSSVGFNLKRILGEDALSGHEARCIPTLALPSNCKRRIRRLRLSSETISNPLGMRREGRFAGNQRQGKRVVGREVCATDSADHDCSSSSGRGRRGCNSSSRRCLMVRTRPRPPRRPVGRTLRVTLRHRPL